MLVMLVMLSRDGRWGVGGGSWLARRRNVSVVAAHRSVVGVAQADRGACQAAVLELLSARGLRGAPEVEVDPAILHRHVADEQPGLVLSELCLRVEGKVLGPPREKHDAVALRQGYALGELELHGEDGVLRNMDRNLFGDGDNRGCAHAVD